MFPDMSSHVPAPEITFHCPRGLAGAGDMKRSKEFATVSGLAQHLESGACSGGKETMKRVVQFVQNEMKNLGFGEQKLLLLLWESVFKVSPLEQQNRGWDIYLSDGAVP
jgi:hypothetical protein